MKHFGKSLVFLFTIVVLFFGSNLASNNVVFASVPQISDCKLNNVSQNTAFNPNNSTIDIDLFTDQSVKFNTISICQENDTVCSRTTAVKYFTYTSSYLETVNKVWDGRTGGSSPTLVSAGTYKIRATLANQGGESNTPGEYCSTNIIVDFSVGSGNSDGGGDDGGGTATTTATTTDPVTATTTSTTTATVTPTSSGGGSYSVHYIQEDLSVYTEPTNIFEVSAGRGRLAYVDSPVSFVTKHKLSKDIENRRCVYTWNFGDGATLVGEKVEHTYKYTGDYNVVLNGKCGDLLAVSRTMVKVSIPSLVLAVKNDGAVEIFNKGKYEINLYGTKLQAQNLAYDFPQDTIISAGQSVIFPADNIKIPITGGEVALLDSTKKSLAQVTVKTLAVNTGRVITMADYERFVVEYEKLAQARATSRQRATLTGEASTPSVVAVNPDQNQLPVSLSATVGSAFIQATSSSVGFWSKVFHPVQTISEAFYQ